MPPTDPFRTLNPRRLYDGVTMVELLIGVAIAGILAVLVFVNIKSMTERAQGVACAANMRQVGTALLTYRSEHNGWFPPGHPKHPAPENTIYLNNVLVPQYLSELPICPGAKKTLTPAQKNAFGTVKKWYQNSGGTYGINDVLTQWKPEAMPWPAMMWGDGSTYSASRMPLVLETRFSGSQTFIFEHQNQVLRGHDFEKIPPRSHGKGDSLNFMFLDGHIEMISRNDPRDVSEAQKSWEFPTNPNGRFQGIGANGRLISHNQMSIDSFEKQYPHLKKTK